MFKSPKSRLGPPSFLLLTAVLILPGCVTTLGDPMPSEGTFLEQSYRTPELQTGGISEVRPEELALILASESGHADVPDLERYTNGVLQGIIEASPQPHHPARVYLVPSATPIAKAFPKGVILASVGLLEQVQNEDELAFILAHELSHSLLEHHDSDWFLEAQEHAVAAAELSADAMEKLKSTVGESPELDWRLAAVSFGAQLVSRDLVFPVFDRRQEDEADLLGVDLMVRAGYNVVGAQSALEIFEELENRYGSDRAAGRSEMARALDISDLERFHEGRAGGVTEDEALARPVGMLFETLNQGVDEFLAFARRSHRPAAERIERIADYAQRAPVDQFPDMTTSRLEAVRQAPAARSYLTNYRAAYDAHEALIEGRLADAELLARQSVTAPTNLHAYTRIALASVRDAQGRPDLWEENLRVALRGPMPPFTIYQELSNRMVMQGRTDEAASLLDEGWERYGKPGYLLPSMIRVAVAAKDQQRAIELHLSCRLEHPRLAEECNTAAGKAAPI